MPWGNSWRKHADQRCSAISFWTRHPPNWARHRVDHGTIRGRGGDKFGARKAVFACNGCAFSPRPPREKIVRVMSAGGGKAALLIVGDIDQLPSVGPGQVLA